MFLTDLAQVARTSGLRVVEVNGWQTRAVDKRGINPPRGVVWHHTGTPNTAAGDYPTLNTILNGRPDLRGPLAQLGLGRSGAVYVCAAGRANHAGGGAWPGLHGNDDCIGIEMESAGRGGWTPEQLHAMPLLRDALMRGYGIPLGNNIAHREWAPGRKDDPVGINIRDMRATPPPPAGPPVLRQGDTGATIAIMQGRLIDIGALPAGSNTGRFDQGTENAVRALQRDHGLTIDGIVGPATQAILDAWHPTLDVVNLDLGPEIPAGSILTPGARLTRPDANLFLVLQGDGNLVLYHNNTPTWASSIRGDKFSPQADGNAVLYYRGRPTWSSGTTGTATKLVLQGDGNLVLYGTTGPIWSTDTWQAGPLRLGTSTGKTL